MTPRTSTHTVALILLGAATAAAPIAGCRSGGSAYELPDQANPAAIQAQVQRASELVRQAQRQEIAGAEAEERGRADEAEEAYDAAIATYQKAIGEFREIPVAWNNMGTLLMKRGENMEAANAFATASELSPTDPRPLYNLGTLWEDLNYFDDAAKWYARALERDPNHQPSLRRSILVDELRNQTDASTADRIKRALLLERDPWWINRFKRLEQRMRESAAERLLPR